MLNYIYAIVVSILALLTGGCGNHRLYIGVEDYDTVSEQRVTKDKGIWQRFIGSDNAQMSGSN
jgi:hypothetical protein